MKSFKKSINSFADRFNFWSRNPVQQKILMDNYRYLNNAQTNIGTSIGDVVRNRHQYARNITAIANSFHITKNMMLKVDLQFKKGDQVLDFNPIKDLWKKPSISTYHKEYEDFMSSIIENFCFIDGNIYILAILEENDDIRTLDVVNTECLAAEMDVFGKKVIRYTINSFSRISPVLRLNLDPFTNIYRAFAADENGITVQCVLFTMEIAFETGSVHQACPLIPLAGHIGIFTASLLRAKALNEKGSDGQFVGIPVANASPQVLDAVQKDYQQKMDGAMNTGATVIIPYTSLHGEKPDKPEVIPFGNKYKDYDTNTDIDASDRRIYEALRVPVTIVKQDAKYVGNQRESYVQLYELKIIPELNRIIRCLEQWILPLIDSGKYKDYTLSIDKTSIDVFQEMRAQYIQSLSFLTLNEKREMFGCKPLPEGDSMQQVGFQQNKQQNT